MTYCYNAKQTVGVGPTTPPGWPPSWPLPPVSHDNGIPDPDTGDYGGPWPPGFPSPIPAIYTLQVDAPNSFEFNELPAIEARVLESGLDTDDLLNHVIQVTAAIGSTTVQLKKTSSDPFDNAIYYLINNYTGIRYGINVTPILDIDASDEGSIITFTCRVVSTDPIIVGSDSSTITNNALWVLAQTITGDATRGFYARLNSTTILLNVNIQPVGVQCWRSTDNGANWSFLSDILTTGGGNGLATFGSGIFISSINNSSNGIMRRSIDSGASWSTVLTHVTPGLSFLALNPNTGVGISIFSAASNFQGVKSVDSGATWSDFTIESGGLGSGTDLYFANSVWLASGNGKTFRSINDGVTWSQVSTFLLRGFLYLTGNTFLATDLSDVYRSTDNGATWSTINSLDTVRFMKDGNGILFCQETDGLSAEDIFKSLNQGTTWTGFQTLPAGSFGPVDRVNGGFFSYGSSTSLKVYRK